MVERGSAPGFEVELQGCRCEPLASYLKALGILRLVGEQREATARGFWRGDSFVLRSGLDRDELVRFFIEQWRPTPVVAPWNGGSGFYPKDNQEAAKAILASKGPRLAGFQSSILAARAFIQKKAWSERPAGEEKIECLSAMRATLGDEALPWLDAAVVIGDDRLLFPPLLGTGGNDGRLDFSNNFQQRVVEVLSAGDSAALLASALFGSAARTSFKGTMGQYAPSANENTNPWDFVLLIEGALMFAAAATRRLESAGPACMAFPFHARASGGLASIAETDEAESRNEVWLPLWEAPATLREIRRLFAEGRAIVGSGESARDAASALDFARAVASLGTDRGIASFTRIGFHVRNGLAYFATPLGRCATQQIPSIRLLDDIERWFDRFRSKASAKNAPARVSAARQRLDLALFEATSTGNLGPTLLALGDAEKALGRSLSFAEGAFLKPVPRLQPAWASEVQDGSVEQRLAASLASRPGMRRRLTPMDARQWTWGREDEPDFVFTERPLVDNLHALLAREEIESLQRRERAAAEPFTNSCSLTDIAAFVEGAVDDAAIERWLRALVLVQDLPVVGAPPSTVLPSACFALLGLAHHRRLGDAELPRTRDLLRRACAGDARGATRAAIQRLHASGRPLPFRELPESPARVRRIAAALAFPLSRQQRLTLESMVLSPKEPNPTHAED